MPAESRGYHGATPTEKNTAFRAPETELLRANEPGQPSCAQGAVSGLWGAQQLDCNEQGNQQGKTAEFYAISITLGGLFRGYVSMQKLNLIRKET